MKKPIIVLSTLFALAIIGCNPVKRSTGSSVSVSPLSDTTRLRNTTLVYALPLTVLTIRFECEQVIEVPGPYSKYAEEMLGLKNVILKEKESMSIKGVSIASQQEADPSEYYVINSNGIFMSNALALRREGLILDFSPEQAEIKMNIGLYDRQEAGRSGNFDLGSDEYFTAQTDTAFRRVSIDSTFIRIPYIVEKRKKLTADQLAERAARRLMELRDGKLLILTGEANVFPQSQPPIDEINNMEKELTELFTGKTFTRKLVFLHTFIPKAESSGKDVTLFHFSNTQGPSEKPVGVSIPVTIRVIAEQKTKDVTMLLSGEVNSSGPKTDKLYYRIPDMAEVRIYSGSKLLFNSRMSICQYGEVMQLPANYLFK